MARALKIGICLLPIGLAINVHVALACQFVWSERTFSASAVQRLRDAVWPLQQRRLREHPLTVLSPQVRWIFVGPGTQVCFIDEEIFDDVRHSQIIQTMGWPMRSLVGEQRIVPGKPPWFLVGAIEAGQLSLSWPASVSRPLMVSRLLPLRPVWSGLVVNTLIYALVAWCAWMLARAGRRCRRRRRGRCPGCGYPIGASCRCSECGQRVRPAVNVQ